MNRETFLKELEKNLNTKDKQEIILYYDEMILDALEFGVDETIFINKLGPISKIVEAIELDDNYIEKLKHSKFKLFRTVLSTSTKIIGLIIFAFLFALVLTIGVTLLYSGLTTLVYTLVKVVSLNDLDYLLILKYLSNIIFGIGILTIAIYAFIYFIKIARKILKEIFKRINKIINKGDK